MFYTCLVETLVDQNIYHFYRRIVLIDWPWYSYPEKLYKAAQHEVIWERIWEKGPIGIFFTNSIPEKLPF